MKKVNGSIGVKKMETAIDIEEYEERYLSLSKYIPVPIRKADTPVLSPSHILEIAYDLGVYPKEEVKYEN